MNTRNIASTPTPASRALLRSRFHRCLTPLLRPLTALPVLLAAVTLFAGAGCATTEMPPPAGAQEPESQKLRAGDIIRIAFPRSPSLDTEQQIRRDGKVNIGLAGHVQAADLTPAELEKVLAEKLSSQLVSNEIRVTVVSSAFSVYVAGAVLKPGKITPERNLTPFQAVMEAGGFDSMRANPKAVVVIREDGTRYTVNLAAFLAGEKTVQPVLHANDTVYVPERRSIF